MTQPPQTEHKTSATINHITSDLSPALLRHIEAGRLNPERAKALSDELEYRTHIISLHRNTARQANAVFFRIDSHESFVDPNHAVFYAAKDQIAHDLATFAEAVTLRFAMADQDYITKTDIAFDFGHADQAGDWSVPAELDELISYATDEAYLQQELNDDRIQVVPHSRDHEKISYKIWNVDLDSAAMVIRKRPYADVTFMVDGEPVCVQIFRKSWFLINIDENNPELRALTQDAEPGKQIDVATCAALAEYLSNVLADDHKDQQAAVLPCTMTYVARVVDARRVAEKEERKKRR